MNPADHFSDMKVGIFKYGQEVLIYTLNKTGTIIDYHPALGYLLSYNNGWTLKYFNEEDLISVD